MQVSSFYRFVYPLPRGRGVCWARARASKQERYERVPIACPQVGEREKDGERLQAIRCFTPKRLISCSSGSNPNPRYARFWGGVSRKQPLPSERRDLCRTSQVYCIVFRARRTGIARRRHDATSEGLRGDFPEQSLPPPPPAPPTPPALNLIHGKQ